MLIDVASVRPLPDYKLDLLFGDRKHGIFDVAPLLGQGVFQRLKDINTFNRACVEYGTITWPGDVDIAPEALYVS
ncbi:MAG: DUF2442 domain-containing protein [Olegusella sp.]|nr:DUF2442 domain-containing protein [Olegusella sp.]